MKPILFTQHASGNLSDRKLNREWAEATIREPDWTEPNPDDPTVERRFRRIPEAGGRVLRVPVVETDDYIRVITVMFDRNARHRR